MSEDQRPQAAASAGDGARHWAAIAAGPLTFLAVQMWARGTDLDPAGQVTAAVAGWMAAWWITEAVHSSVTALLPIVLLPALGALPLRAVTTPYASPLVFLFMGGFFLARAMQRWRLHERMALGILRRVGTRPRQISGGFILVTALVSMWMSNTATVAMMLPIAMRVADFVGQAGFATGLLLTIAYAASIGGVATLVGTPTNVVLAGYTAEHLGREIGFVEWMAIGVPFALVFLPILWWLMTTVLFRFRDDESADAGEVVEQAYRELGAWSRGEWITLGAFLAAAVGWLLRPALGIPGLSDAGIAMAAALTLFVIPVDPARRVFALDWDNARQISWGTLILVGGGLSLASAMEKTGVAAMIGQSVAAWAGASPWVVLTLVVALLIFLTELTSNAVTAATLIPILAHTAPELGFAPMELIVPAAIAASCAFMLPVATPPNAIVFGSGQVELRSMMRAGLWLNLLAIALVVGLSRLLPVLSTSPPQ